MPNPRLTQIIAELPFEKKIVGLGSILMVIGLFFPWYQDVDSFRTGDTFTGLTGPMYLAGFSFLVLASLSLFVMVMDYLDKKVPLFKVKAAKIHLWAGLVSFYLLTLVGSVYFHPAFGVNITLKQSGFGMFIAYASAALLTIGGYMGGRGKAAVKAFEKETRLPEAKPAPQPQPVPVAERKVVHPMIEQRKPRENLRTMPQPQAPAPEQPTMPLEANRPATATTPAPVQAGPVPAAQAQVNAEPDRKVQPFRMDL